MFAKKRQQTESQRSMHVSSSESATLKYHHPKILLIDLKDEIKAVLKAEGYNVEAGSFGVPYRVPKDDKLFPVITNGSLPSNLPEREIIVIDLFPANIIDQPIGEKQTSPGESDWWASCSEGIIDPRPRSMIAIQKDFDRIFEHGGIFIVFASGRYRPRVIRGYKNYSGIQKEEDVYCDNWQFLSILGDLDATDDSGEEISVLEKETLLRQVLSEHANGGHFLCTLRPNKWSERITKAWRPLATNKFGAPVAGQIAAAHGKGWIFVFPQLSNRQHFLLRFLKEVLPEISPELFPHLEGARWVRKPEYELTEVLELRNQITRIQETANQKVVELETAIQEKRAAMSYLYDLIRATGRPLVEAVKQTLETLGFRSVLDADKQIEQPGAGGTKREDLQIRDNSPTVLVEVKGIAGLPRDSEALQVWKYAAPRMREWQRTDVRGLAIINHQRNLPPLDRDNNTPFREDVLTNAQEQQFGLLTTWDLFRLARSYLKLGWQHEHIQALFYKSGRVEPVPQHYELIGIVEHIWEKAGAVGVRIEAAVLRLGDRIAFELPVEFEEHGVESLQVDKNPVSQAEVGMLAGIQTSMHKGQLKKGTRVFRLI